MGVLPIGTVSLVFSDVEGSTDLVRALGPNYGGALDAYRQIMRQAVADASGREVDCRADEFFAAFTRVGDALQAAVAAQRALTAHAWADGGPIRARIGIHVGEPAVVGDAYLGLDVNRAARTCAAGHGGQILLSETARVLLADTAETKDLGLFALAGMPAPERLYQLVAPGLRREFPPPRAGQPAGRRDRRRLHLDLRHRRPTLADAAWRARELAHDAEPALAAELGRLAASLFRADRAVQGAEGFLERHDPDRVGRRMANHRRVAVRSPLIRMEIERLTRQVSTLREVHDRHQALAARTPVVLAQLTGRLSSRSPAALRANVESDTADLDRAVGEAAAAVDRLSRRLHRTRHRGVYRVDQHYAVPFVDDMGADRQREFDTLAEAVQFRSAVMLARKRHRAFTGI